MSQYGPEDSAAGVTVPGSKVDPRRVVDMAAAQNDVFANWKKQMDEQLSEARKRQAAVSAELKAARFEATSRDQVATVAVGPGGALQSVRLSDRARSATPVQISQSIMSAYRAATDEAAEATVAAVERLAGADEAERVRSYLPHLIDEDGAR